MNLQFHPTAEISSDVKLARNVTVWRFTTILDKVIVGENTIIGSYVYIGAEVNIGANCKIQNNANIFEGSYIGNGVFVGPGVILTNDKFPRAINRIGQLKSYNDWTRSSVTINNYASLGAGVICIAPVQIGQYALIGAGSVVTRDVGDFEYGFGNPYSREGWVGRLGFPLKRARKKNVWVCPNSGEEYLEYFSNNNKYLKRLIP